MARTWRACAPSSCAAARRVPSARCAPAPLRYAKPCAARPPSGFQAARAHAPMQADLRHSLSIAVPPWWLIGSSLSHASPVIDDQLARSDALPLRRAALAARRCRAERILRCERPVDQARRCHLSSGPCAARAVQCRRDDPGIGAGAFRSTGLVGHKKKSAARGRANTKMTTADRAAERILSEPSRSL